MGMDICVLIRATMSIACVPTYFMPLEALDDIPAWHILLTARHPMNSSRNADESCMDKGIRGEKSDLRGKQLSCLGSNCRLDFRSPRTSISIKVSTIDSPMTCKDVSARAANVCSGCEEES